MKDEVVILIYSDFLKIGICFLKQNETFRRCAKVRNIISDSQKNLQESASLRIYKYIFIIFKDKRNHIIFLRIYTLHIYMLSKNNVVSLDRTSCKYLLNLTIPFSFLSDRNNVQLTFHFKFVFGIGNPVT